MKNVHIKPKIKKTIANKICDPIWVSFRVSLGKLTWKSVRRLDGQHVWDSVENPVWDVIRNSVCISVWTSVEDLTSDKLK